MPAKDDAGRKRIWGLNPNVFFLGIVSFLTDINHEIPDSTGGMNMAMIAAIPMSLGGEKGRKIITATRNMIKPIIPRWSEGCCLRWLIMT